MADPFDLANADQPAQGGGVSPDFWHNLMMFGGGLATAANARNGQGFLTYGGDFSGPFGAALQQTGQQSLETAKTKSSIAAQGADTQGRQIQNQLAALGLPMARLRAQAASDPALLQQLLGGAPQLPQDQSAATPQGGASQAPASFAGGGGSIANNPAIQPIVAAKAQQYGIPLPLANAYLQQESSFGTNPAAKGNIGQITFKTANNPGYGMTPLSGADLTDPTKNIDFSLQYLRKAGDQAGVKNWNDPSQWGIALQAYNGGGDPNYVQNVARWLPKNTQVAGGAAQSTPPSFQVAQAGNGPIPVPQSSGGSSQGAPQVAQNQPQQGNVVPGQGGFSPGYITPQQAFQRAEASRQQAIRLQMLGFDATPATQQAAAWQEYGQKQLLQQTQPTTIRGPGSASINPATGSVIQSPLEYETTGPDMRKYRITQNAIETGQPYQRPAGVPAWAPPGTLSVTLSEPSPGEHTAVTDAAADAFGEKSRAQYASAAGTVRTMEDMEQQVDRLNAGGPNWYNTGAGAAAKLEFAKTINGLAQSTGLGTGPFDIDKLAAGEDVTKQAKLAGMQVLSTMFGGSKEAASIIHSTQAAVPNIENTPQGFKLLVNGYKEAARWQMDQHAFMTNWYAQHAGNMVGADVAFTQQYRPEMYTRRGISQVQPYEIPGSNPTELKRFLPGTQVIVKADPTKTPRVIPGDTEIPLQMPQQQPALGAPPQ